MTEVEETAGAEMRQGDPHADVAAEGADAPRRSEPGGPAEPDPRGAVEAGEPEGDGSDDEDEGSGPRFSTLGEFVTQRIIPIYSRPEGGQFRWCAEWWRHEEAFLRFHALWHTWELMRTQPGGLANWYRDHFDFQFSIITGDTGPFRECTSRRHHDPRPLAHTPYPDDWFEDES